MSRVAKLPVDKPTREPKPTGERAVKAKKLLTKFARLGAKMAKTYPNHADTVSTVREIRAGK